MELKEFVERYKAPDIDSRIADYYNFFLPTIKQAENFAIGPFFWYISDYQKMTIALASENVKDLTPYNREELYTLNAEKLSDQHHPEDRLYILAAFSFLHEAYLNLDEAGRKSIKFNIYDRFLNNKGEYRWVMIQVPGLYINSQNQIESALVIFYDLSHLKISGTPLMSMINYAQQEVQYFKHIDKQIKKADLKTPYITKREKEILYLMSQGYNTPEIAQKLFISYHTVENHKRNLRKKTHTKTSSALLTYVITHNLLLIEPQ